MTLTRTLEHANLVRGVDGLRVFRELGLESAAASDKPMADFVDANPGFRLLDERFMEIRQAVGTTRDRATETVRFLRDVVEELKANGFIADALRRSHQLDAAVAPPG